MAPIAAAVPEEVSLFDKINISSSTWYVAVNMENAFFLTPINKYHKKLFKLPRPAITASLPYRSRISTLQPYITI